MRKFLVLLMVLGLVAGLLAVTGCGDDKTTVQTPEGEITFEEGNGEITFETEEGDVTYEGSDRPPSEEELGVPVYPGAEYVEDSGWSMMTTTPEGEVSTGGAEFSTQDSFDKVVAFYEDELGATMGIMEGTQATWTKVLDDGTVTVVNVSDEGGEILITLARSTGMDMDMDM